MKKPTLQQVAEHFKNAKVVECAYTKNEVDISINVQKEPYPLYDEYWMDLEKSHYNNVQFNLWNKDTGYSNIISYKEACGIETKPETKKLSVSQEQGEDHIIINGVKYVKEPEFVISREQIDELCKTKHGRRKCREWFPELFAKNLEINKWYKTSFGSLVLNTDGKLSGFVNGSWKDCIIEASKLDSVALSHYKQATESEVFEALKAKAVKLGFDRGVYYRLPNSETVSVCSAEIMLNKQNNSILYFGDYCIFKEGIWGTILETITKEQAEKELNRKIVG